MYYVDDLRVGDHRDFCENRLKLYSSHPLQILILRKGGNHVSCSLIRNWNVSFTYFRLVYNPYCLKVTVRFKGLGLSEDTDEPIERLYEYFHILLVEVIAEQRLLHGLRSHVPFLAFK